VQQLSSRPTDNNIKEPVDATDFVHVACSCSFVTYPTDWEFRERLRSVLDTLLEPGRQQLPSPLSQLEALCVHIMRQIPEGVLLSVPLLLCHFLAMLAGLAANNFWLPSVAASSCSPSLRWHLTAYKASPDSPSPIDPRIDFARSFMTRVNGSVQPTQSFSISSKFMDIWVSTTNPSMTSSEMLFAQLPSVLPLTPAIRKFFNHLIQQSHHCASSYIRHIESSSTYFPFVLGPRLTSDFGTCIGAQCRQLPRSLSYMKPSFSTPISKRNIFTFSRSSYPMRVRTF